jgi:hypothetical protein
MNFFFILWGNGGISYFPTPRSNKILNLTKQTTPCAIEIIGSMKWIGKRIENAKELI